MIRWGTLPWRDRSIVVGAAGVLIGAGAVLLARGRNMNDVPGAAVVLVLLGLIVMASWWVTRANAVRAAKAAPVFLAASLAALVLSGLELLESLRAGFATDRLGLLGLAGRAIGFVSSGLLVGAVGRSRPPAALGGLSRLLLMLGSLAIIAGWVALIVLADGFAMRAVDAAGIAAAIGCTLLALVGHGRVAQVAAFGMALVAAVVGLDAVVILVPQLGSLADGGAATLGALGSYLLGVVVVVAGAVLHIRRRVASPPGVAGDSQ